MDPFKIIAIKCCAYFRNAELLDCSESGRVRCHHFDCRIRGLRANESAVIRFRSRIWNSTLTSEFEPGYKVVILRTSASLVIPETLDIAQVSTATILTLIETKKVILEISCFACANPSNYYYNWRSLKYRA